jgi:ABC-type branched-subunit amino acid transport system permease subunit
VTPPRSILADRGRELKPSGLRGVLGGLVPLAVAIGVALLLHFVLKPILPPFYARILLDIGISVILAVSLTMVNGFTGQFSMGHAAFMAVGAYVAATLVYYGSARIFGTPDFADANAHGGVLSTVLSARDADIAGGKFEQGKAGEPAVFVLEDDATLDPGRRYRARLADDYDQVEPAVPLAVDGAEHHAGDRLPVRAGAQIDPKWYESDLRLMAAPRSFSTGDGLFLLSLFAGGVVAAGCGYLVGLPSLRLRGDYLAIVTLGFGEIVRVLIQSQTTDTLYDTETIARTPVWELPRYMGGPVGFTGVPSYTSLFWVWLFAVITLVVAYRLKESTFGRAYLSIREDEIAAEAMGVKTTRYKVEAFVIAAFFAGVAGALYAHTIGIQLNAGELGFMKSFDIIIMVVLGGMGSISGAAIAAAILTILPEALRNPPSVFNPILGGVILASAVLILIFSARRLRSLILLAVSVGVYAAVRRAALAAGVHLADYRMVLYALALVLMMILRPQGLFGVRELWNAWRIHPLRHRRNYAEGGESGTAGKVPVE